MLPALYLNTTGEQRIMDASVWNRYQEWLYYHPKLDLYVDVSRMRFDSGLMEAFKPRFDKAFRDMAALEAGAMANPDEKRMAGHYWLRNPDLAPNPELRLQIVRGVEQIESFVKKVHDGTVRPPGSPRFTDVMLIGIGGSALGPQLLYDALAGDQAPMAVHFLDNTDPAGIDRTFGRIQNRLQSTLVVVISKSGGTPESRNGMLEAEHAFKARGLQFAGQAVAVTMQGSVLHGQAKAQGWLAVFPMYDWVGGRFSVTSTVGLLPAALQGIDIRAFLSGAREMDDATRVPDVRSNPAALLAFCWHFAGGGAGRKDMVVLPYKDSLLLFARYLQQLIMESLGKEKDMDGATVHQGIAVYGNKGSTDQHAYVQQLRDGLDNFFVTFIEVLEDRRHASVEVEPGITSGDYLSGFLQGTRQALHENHRDSITLTVPRVDPRSVGALIALYERAVGFYASLVNINAYHQPGVEAGKKAAASILDLQKRLVQILRTESKPLTVEALAEKAGAPERIESVYHILRHLAANNRGVVLTGDRNRPSALTVSCER
jgi:glucose-6-phosphate isomerase